MACLIKYRHWNRIEIQTLHFIQITERSHSTRGRPTLGPWKLLAFSLLNMHSLHFGVPFYTIFEIIDKVAVLYENDDEHCV